MVADVAEMEMTVVEAAAFASVSDRTIRNWINEGALAASNTPAGRKVGKEQLLDALRAKGYAPPALDTVELFPQRHAEATPKRAAAAVVTEEQETGPTAAETSPTDTPQPVATAGPALAPETINLILQPLVEQLNAANARAERKEQENLELAGRVGYLQAKVQQYEERVLLLEAPKESPVAPPEVLPLTQPPMAAPEAVPDAEKRLPWYKRLFSTE